MANGQDVKQLSDEELLAQLQTPQAQAGPDVSALSDEELLAQLEAAEAPTVGEQAQTALEEFGQTAALGVLPQIQAGLEPVTQPVFEALTGQEAAPLPTFEERVAENVERLQRQRERAPGAAALGTVAGAIGGGGLLGGAARGLRAATGLGRVAPAATTLGRAGQVAAEGAAIGAVESPLPTQEELKAEETFLGVPFRPVDRLKQATIGAGIGGAIPVIGKAITAAPKKILSSALGVKERPIREFLLHADEIKRIEEEEGLSGVVEIINQRVGKIRQAFLDSKISTKEADESVKALEAQARAEFKLSEAQLKKSLQRSKQRLDDAFKTHTSELKLTPPPRELKETIFDSVNLLKENAIRKSQAATDLLPNDIPQGVTLDKNPLIDSVQSEIDDLLLDGTAATDLAEKTIQQLEGFKLRIQQTIPDGPMSPLDVKKFIKILDRETTWISKAGEFSDSISRSRINLRRALDEQLKTASPSYAQAMQEVADDFQFLDNARQFYDTPQKIESALNNIDKANSATKLEVLEELSQRTGVDFRAPLDDYMQTKQILKDINAFPEAKQRAMRGLTEFEDYEQAKTALERLQADGVDVIEAEIGTQRARARLEQSRRVMQERQAAIEPFKQLSSKEAIQNKVIKLGNLLNNESPRADIVRQQFDQLSQMSDTDFVKLIDRLSTADAFTKDFTRGSRNTNIWALTMNAASSIISPQGAAGAAGGFLVGGPAAAAVGGIMGGMVDSFGPRVTRSILEGVLKMRGLPGIKQIRQMDVPESVKDELVDQFRRTILIGAVGDDSTVTISPNARPFVEKQIRENKALNANEKASLLNTLNKDSEVDLEVFYKGDIKTIQPSTQLKPQDVRGARQFKPVQGR